MAQQTAVEWLAEKTAELGYVSSNILEQAKAMEKAALQNTFIEGGKAGFNAAKGNAIKTFGEYYEETYKQSAQQ